ncbi:MAG: bifunctional oligoribonuclease/PAP phosphatase NrnA [Candidatus Omnitrophota bacterium]
MSLKKAIECIKKHNNFVVTSHTNLEGDALGSELAFFRLLRRLGKRARVINEDSVPQRYAFLPDTERIKKLSRNTADNKFDCFAVLDCSDLNRTGRVHLMNKDKKTILNIDHHISNVGFGNINWVQPHASSCSEMVYKIYKKLRLPFDKKTALLLYTGILTDTGSFRYRSTSAFTHQAVSDLLKYKIDAAGVHRKVYEDIPYEDLLFLSGILQKIKLAFKGKVAWIEIGRGILKKKGSSIDLNEEILKFARAIKGVEVVALFKENLGSRQETRINLRSSGKIDVNKIAAFFGGGGHRTASGCTLSVSLSRAKKCVLAEIKKYLRS